ncbi:MAG: Mrp/NBP35 family ATP-binding protein [Halobacteriota archaeon]
MNETATGGSIDEAIDEALTDAAIGRDVLFRGLVELEGLGSVTVADGTATVPVTLPIADPNVRTQLQGEIESAIADVAGIDRVECRFEPQVPDPDHRTDLLGDVKHVIAVSSGKGGVGKSTVATNLAVALSAAGASVGLLDADVYGPNAPQMLGLDDRTPATTHDDRMTPREAHGVSVMSMGLIADEDDPVIWRGVMVDGFLKQLFDDVEWGSLDYLVVDLPPGTGDAQLSLVQHLPLTGAVIVTTPQQVAVDDAQRGLEGFVRYDVPILGIAENMVGFQCPDCHSVHDIFGAGGGDRMRELYEIPVLGRIPIDPAVADLDADEEPQTPPGISIPGFGRLQLPRTRAERDGSVRADPIAIRADGGETRRAIELLATRTAARINETTIVEFE